MASSKRRLSASDPAQRYRYPEHLLAQAQQAPAAPGVYVFHAEDASLPLYIGKSINLRARLLSHLRNPDETRMLQQAHRISYVRTAGDIGALLLEAHMIKTQQPLFNQRLRRHRQLCAWRLENDRPELVYSSDVDFAQASDLYGLYSSRSAAQSALQSLADQHQLCLGVLGLEKISNGKPCFRSRLKRCLGACCSKEMLTAHHLRLRQALESVRLITWPYPGAIGLIEQCDNLRQIHVFHHWCYLGSKSTLTQARRLATVAAGFDADGYKILCRPILTEQLPVVLL